MDQPRVRNLTNTEKIALASIISKEEQATRQINALRSAFEADLRVRLNIGADGSLRIDVAGGTVEVVPFDSSPPN